ncbi:MAG: hypothetical protein ACR2PK_14655 [Acidimicrobiales bacterium]
MSTCAVTAAMRTPWALRHGSLNSIDPSTLLASALESTRTQRAIDSTDIDLLLVACDTSVGAQAVNIARRSVLELGWSDVVALTVDGQRAAALALVGLASQSSATTMVASIDCTSTVPPGADLVRDYGRPRRSEPEIETLDALVSDRGISSRTLDELAAAMREPPTERSPAVAPVRVGSRTIDRDEPDPREFDELTPLTSGGVVTAWHVAEYADGAAAVIVEPTDGIGRQVAGTSFAAEPAEHDADSLEKLVRNADAEVVVAEPSAVLLAAAGLLRPHPRVASPLALGSAPSGDGLRCLVDAWHTIDDEVLIVSRGDHCQTSTVTLGPSY